MAKARRVWEIKVVSRVLIISTILLIAVFQCWWINGLYKDEWNNLKRETDVMFRDAIYKLQMQRFRNDTVFFKSSLHDNLFVFDVIDSVKEKYIDSALKRSAGERKVVISMTSHKDSFHAPLERMMIREDSAFDFPAPPPEGSPRIIQYFSNSKSFNDSISISKIDSAYKAELEKSSIDIPFKIIVDSTVKRDSKPVSDSNDLSTNFTFVGLSKGFAYRAVFDNPFMFIVKKISLPIMVSVLLIAFTIASFVFLYRNLMVQRRLAEMKNEFISNITHELKTPIATVNVAIEALRNFDALDDPKRTKEYLDISASELQRLSLLVDKVLRLSMFENKEIELSKEELDLKELIAEVIRTMQLQFEKFKANVTFNYEGNNFVIHADRLHITSVIYNLLDNALKYSKENPVIEVNLTEKNKDLFELRIKDNGIGIAPEYRSKVFDKFFRVPADDKHNIKGYGLGLSYVSEIIKRHMGFIYVESELGKGSAFIIFIPVKEMPVIHIDENRKIIKKTLRL